MPYSEEGRWEGPTTVDMLVPAEMVPPNSMLGSAILLVKTINIDGEPAVWYFSNSDGSRFEHLGMLVSATDDLRDSLRSINQE